MWRRLFLSTAFACVTVAVTNGQQTVLYDKAPEAEEPTLGAEVEPKFAASAEARAAEMREAIAREAETMVDHPWAGAYYFGDGLGVNASLALAPKAGCVFEWYGCMGLYDRNYGQATEKDGRLSLKLEFPNEEIGFQGVAEELIPIQWGKRHYLISAKDIVSFCNIVNSGIEPRKRLHGRYLLRRGDEDADVEGKPVVPEAYAAYLLESPVEAEVIDVGQVKKRPSRLVDRDFHEIPITLNCGKTSGLLTGMEMYLVHPETTYGSLMITEVREESCEAIMTQFFGELTTPEEGWKFSTRRYPIEKAAPQQKRKQNSLRRRKVKQALLSR